MAAATDSTAATWAAKAGGATVLTARGFQDWRAQGGWFVLGVMGFIHIFDDLEIFLAFNPLYGLGMLVERPVLALAVSGGARLGHLGELAAQGAGDELLPQLHPALELVPGALLVDAALLVLQRGCALRREEREEQQAAGEQPGAHAPEVVGGAPAAHPPAGRSRASSTRSRPRRLAAYRASSAR